MSHTALDIKNMKLDSQVVIGEEINKTAIPLVDTGKYGQMMNSY